MKTEAASAAQIDTLVVVGVGLIGGSLALALKSAGAVRRVIGVDRSAENLRQALERGVIDAAESDLARAAGQADLICLATPVGMMQSLLDGIRDAVSPACVITDVGSVKAGIAAQAVAVLGPAASRFVPGHPVAGKEQSGVQAACAGLFAGHKVVLTPLPQGDAQALDRVRKMWQSSGAQVVEMRVDVHDRVLSITSHLPHVLAYVTVQQMLNSGELENCHQMAAGGFYDFTRIASSDPEMWRDICLMNRVELLAQLQQFQHGLEQAIGMLRRSDGKAIEQLFDRSRRARAVLVDQLAVPPDASG